MTIVEELGARLRAVRSAKGMSLEDVQRAAGPRATPSGRWRASVIAAYERGARTISVPRLHELAAFYDVPVTVLLGQPDEAAPGAARKVVFDLEALRRLAGSSREPGRRLRLIPEAERVWRFVRSIIVDRGDYNGRVLSVRHSDLGAICALIGADTPDTAYAQLDAWGVLAASSNGLQAGCNDEDPA